MADRCFLDHNGMLAACQHRQIDAARTIVDIPINDGILVIDINMDVSGNSITFKCSNSLVKSNDTAKKNYSGIGLENAEKRLNLLFPGRHELKIMKDSSKFDVLLFINFA